MSIVILNGSVLGGNEFYFYAMFELEETLLLRLVSIKLVGSITFVRTAFWNFSKFYFNFLFYSYSL